MSASSLSEHAEDLLWLLRKYRERIDIERAQGRSCAVNSARIDESGAIGASIVMTVVYYSVLCGIRVKFV